MLPLAVLPHWFELGAGLYFALFSGSPSSADSWLGEISEDFGDRNPVERWEKSNFLIAFGMFLASGKSLKPCYEAGKILRFYILCFKEDTLFLLTDTLMKRRKKKVF